MCSHFFLGSDILILGSCVVIIETHLVLGINTMYVYFKGALSRCRFWFGFSGIKESRLNYVWFNRVSYPYFHLTILCFSYSWSDGIKL